MMWRIAMLIVAVLALVGCRTDPNVPVLERELRMQEDRIYQLQEELAQSRAALAACRGHAVPSSKPAAGPPAPPPAEVTGPTLAPAAPPEAATQPPIVELPSQPQSEMPKSLQLPQDPPPKIEQPKSSPPAAEPARPAPSTNRTWQKASTGGQTSERARTSTPIAPVAQGKVQRILLNPALTGGLNVDGRPGDEGLTVFIEPQDSQGHFIPRPAPVSVVVLDRQLRGQTARIARWDFTADEIAKRMRRTSVGSGISLDLPWPSQPPAHGDLQVFVRYVADDSHQFETDMRVTVELPGQPKQWTAAAPGTRKPVLLPPVNPAPTPASVPAVVASPSPAATPVAVQPAPRAAAASDAQPEPASPAPTQTQRQKRRSPTEVRRPVWSPNR